MILNVSIVNVAFWDIQKVRIYKMYSVYVRFS